MKIVVLLLAALGGSTAAAVAQAPAPAATAQRPALERLADSLVVAINSGDSTQVIRFAELHLGRDVRGRSAAGMRNLLVKLQAQSGGVRVERQRAAGRALRLFGVALQGERRFGMELEPVAGDSTRLASLLVVPLEGGARPAPWSTERLADDALAALVRERVKAAADSDRFSGVVLVARGDSILVHEAHGWADRAEGRRNTLATRFATMSLGKMFTGVAVAQLVAGGKLQFDDTLAAVLQGYPNADAARHVTIEQLLTHTAGVPEPFLAERFDVAHAYESHLQVLGAFADAPLSATGGTRHEYSNGNYAALAAVVEQLSGMTFEEYLRAHMWGPAGMQVARDARAVGHARYSELDPLGLEPRRPETVRGIKECPRVLGFGCGAYTAADLFRFARALRTGTLLPVAMADTVMKGRVKVMGPVQYAYGFYDDAMDGVRLVGHSGSNPDTGHDADLQMVPEGDWTVIVLSNFDAPAGTRVMVPILEVVTRQVKASRQGSQ